MNLRSSHQQPNSQAASFGGQVKEGLADRLQVMPSARGQEWIPSCLKSASWAAYEASGTPASAGRLHVPARRRLCRKPFGEVEFADGTTSETSMVIWVRSVQVYRQQLHLATHHRCTTQEMCRCCYVGWCATSPAFSTPTFLFHSSALLNCSATQEDDVDETTQCQHQNTCTG